MRLRHFSIHCIACPVLLLLLTGCANYEYDILQPSNLRQHISHDRETILQRDALEYRMQAAEDHLVVRVFNRSGQMLKFLGDQSTIVDPSGQSHPMRGTTLPPGSFMRIVMPPLVRVEPTGPHITFGLGMGFVGYRHGYYGAWGGPFLYDPFWDSPRYLVTADGGDSYWEWNGESDARLVLTFQRDDDKPFTQEWLFHRRKMNR